MIPTLTTPRLKMRAPARADFDAYAAFRASPRMEHIGGPTDRSAAWHSLTAIAGQWTLRGYGRWIVADATTDAPLGIVGVHHPDDWPEAEIGWSVFDEAEGKGIAHEAALAARAFAYGPLGFDTIASMIAEGNARSEALARRLGCRPDGTFRHPAYGEMTIWRHPDPEATA